MEQWKNVLLYVLLLSGLGSATYVYFELFELGYADVFCPGVVSLDDIVFLITFLMEGIGKVGLVLLMHGLHRTRRWLKLGALICGPIGFMMYFTCVMGLPVADFLLGVFTWWSEQELAFLLWPNVVALAFCGLIVRSLVMDMRSSSKERSNPLRQL